MADMRRRAARAAAAALVAGAAALAVAVPAAAAPATGHGAMITRNHAHRSNVWTDHGLKCASCNNPSYGALPEGISIGSRYERQGAPSGTHVNAGNDGNKCQGYTEGLMRRTADTSTDLAATASGNRDAVTLQNAGGTGDTWCFNKRPDGSYKIINRYWSGQLGDTQELSIDCGAGVTGDPIVIRVDGANGMCQRWFPVG
jgi:hypothetical protein